MGKDHAVIDKGGSNTEDIIIFYKVVLQSILLYGLETWVVMGRIIGSLQQIN